MLSGDVDKRLPPTLVADIRRPAELVECCHSHTTVPGSENIILTAGEGHLTLLAAYPEGGPGSLREIDVLQGKLQHSGPAVHAIAWAKADPQTAPRDPCFASIGPGRANVHMLCSNGEPKKICDTMLPSRERINSCCFLTGERRDHLAYTGDDCACSIVRYEKTTCTLERCVMLRSPGVAVRTHLREPGRPHVTPRSPPLPSPLRPPRYTAPAHPRLLVLLRRHHCKYSLPSTSPPPASAHAHTRPLQTNS